MSCHDYKERGGFRFDPSGSVGYNCFNCGIKVGYNPAEAMSSAFTKLLASFGIPENELTAMAGQAWLDAKAADPTIAKKVEEWSPPQTCSKPPPLISVKADDSPWCEVAREYLKTRGMTPDFADFYVSDDFLLEGRLVILFKHRGRLIYWQGRAMDSGIEPRYLGPSASEKEKVFYNYDQLLAHTSEPLFVTEGPLDAISIGEQGISGTGSAFSDWQWGELRKAGKRRPIIFVIDKNSNGYKLGKRALAEGYAVTAMPDNLDDANDGLKAYGRLWLLSHLAATQVSGFQGQVLLELVCDKQQKHGEKNKYQ